MVQMGEVDTTQHTVRQPPQLGSKKNKYSKQQAGAYLLFGSFSSSIIYEHGK
jgi:hypothetical protein